MKLFNQLDKLEFIKIQNIYKKLSIENLILKFNFNLLISNLINNYILLILISGFCLAIFGGLNLLILFLNLFMFIVSLKNKKYIDETNENLKRTMTDYSISVSVLIAARNEEGNIEKCIRSLMNQSYFNYEILVMNDHSTDATDQIIKKLEEEYNQSSVRLKYYSNTTLDDGWYGKSNAIQYLSTKATGQYLIITDADTVHNYDSIKFCVHSLKSLDLAFLSGKLKIIKL